MARYNLQPYNFSLNPEQAFWRHMSHYNLHGYNRLKYNYAQDISERMIWRARILYDRIEAVAGAKVFIFYHVTLSDSVSAQAQTVLMFCFASDQQDQLLFSGSLRVSTFVDTLMSDVLFAVCSI